MRLFRVLTLDLNWFDDRRRLSLLLSTLKFDPQTFELVLKCYLKPMDQIAGLEANGWDIDKETSGEVVAIKSKITMTITANTLNFDGFDIKQLFADDSEATDAQKLLAG